jgi:hypothetical protein
MFVYFHWPKNGAYNATAFYKESSAIEYVFSSISELINYNRSYKSKPKKIKKVGFIDADGFEPIHIDMFAQVAQQQIKEEEYIPEELFKLKEHMVFSSKQKTFENAMFAISLYEEYAAYVLLEPAAIHTLQDLKVVK